jgi:superfamily I DNA/RNA helicase
MRARTCAAVFRARRRRFARHDQGTRAEGHQARRVVRAAVARLAREERGFTRNRPPRPRKARASAGGAIYAAYQKRLAAFNAVDFDDLIRLPLAVLEGDTEARDAWRERCATCWSTNTRTPTLRSTASQGARGRARRVHRGRRRRPVDLRLARRESENLNELARDFPKLRVVKLEQNYRCARRILRCANKVIANNGHLFEKRLWSEQGEGAPIRVLECRDDEHEAECVAGAIAHLAERHKAPWSEFAILYRGNHQSRAGKGAAPGARAVSRQRRHRVPRSRRGEGSRRVSASDRQSRRRRGVPARGQPAAPRHRRDDAGKTRRTRRRATHVAPACRA